jgi:glycerol kinase
MMTGSAPPRLLAVDAGTTSVRCLAVTEEADVTAVAQREFAQHYPRPGWVEHDATEIWHGVQACIADVLADPSVDPTAIAAIGITNQRETVVAWDRRTGVPLARAIVWQDRRTAHRCRELTESGATEEIRRTTGLVCDPYFSATKMEWLLREGGVPVSTDLAFGTIDAWLTYKLTGGKAHVTDASNASRTMLYDLSRGDWAAPLLDRFGVPAHTLPSVTDSSGVAGTTDPDEVLGLRVAVAGLGGDQQCSLFGQACFHPGMTKNTYGTGSFVLANTGTKPPPPTAELLATVAWRISGETTFALEGSIFVTGAAVQWLRDRLGLIGAASDVGPLAASVPDSGGVVVVPAFAGLGAPHWNPNARGAIFGLSRGVTRAHLARAVVEAMAYQTRDVVDAVNRTTGEACQELRVDGGAAVMDLLCQFQADQLGVDVARSANTETTALGAAFLAGLATGVWSSQAEIESIWRADRRFVPSQSKEHADRLHANWTRAVARVRQVAQAATGS